MKKKCFFFAPLFFLSVLTFADDTTTNTVVYGDKSFKPRTDLSVSDRLLVLERQMNNLNQQNISQQIQDLQGQIADLKGRFDSLQHNYDQLQNQVKQQYKDMDQRVSDLSTAAPPAVVAAPTTAEKNAKKAVKLEENEAALTNPPAAPDTATIASSEAEQKLYQKAFSYLKKKDYVRAIPAFQSFLSKYPSGQFAPNAYFWLGEVYLLQGQPDLAVTNYRKVILDFSQSDKVQMAQLKLGFAYRDAGSLPKARVQWQKVVRLYPGTTAAKLATQQLASTKNG